MLIKWNERLTSNHTLVINMYRDSKYYIHIVGNRYYTVLDTSAGIKTVYSMSDLEIGKYRINIPLLNTLRQTTVVVVGKRVIIKRHRAAVLILPVTTISMPDSIGKLFHNLGDDNVLSRTTHV